MRRNFYKLALILVVVALIVSGCSAKDWPVVGKFFNKPAVGGQPSTTTVDQNQDNTDSLKDQLAKQSKVKQFTNLGELKEFMAKSAATQNLAFGEMRGGLGMVEAFGAPMAEKSAVADRAADAAAPDGRGGGSAATDYSKTNVQVEGVDEPDIIKTDGQYIYAAVQNTLYVISAMPADQAEIIAKLEFKAMPQDIILAGDRLAVFGQDYEVMALPAKTAVSGEAGGASSSVAAKMVAPGIMPYRRSEATYFKAYDISNRKEPKLIRDLAFEGYYQDARLIGDYAYFVINAHSNYYDEMPVPRMMNRGDFIKEDNPKIYYFDLPYTSYNFTRVTAINLKDDNAAPTSQIYLLSADQHLYVSSANLYITYTKYLSEQQIVIEATKEMMLPRLPADDQAKITKIDTADDYILSPEEKLAKISNLIERYVRSLPAAEQEAIAKELDTRIKSKYQDLAKELEKTVIHKIAIDRNNLAYKTFGEVTGQVLNQYSMDESSGYFRIATTKNRTWSSYSSEDQNESYSNLYVLDGDLKVVGSLENLAKDERIYSARFMGKRAYLVTFKQTDPLFAIDLSEPTNPKVLGELKIPGFSTYLHPYDDTTLIGLGHDAEQNQWGGTVTTGLKIALFDVSEVGAPKELDKYQIGGRGSDSEALNEPHAFLFSRDKNLLVIPASIREGSDSSWGRFTFSGALVFDTTDKKIKLKGRVDHSDGGASGKSEFWYGYNFYDNTVRRSLYIGDMLFTLSSRYLKANKLADLAALKTLKLSDTPEIIPMPKPTPLPIPMMEEGGSSSASPATESSN